MNKNRLIEHIKQKESYLCIGLDTDITKIPKHLSGYEDPAYEFNKQIIDATHDLCVAYKLNLAFYESNGCQGWKSLEKTQQYLSEYYPQIFEIADAKRGDIGNTSTQYAKAFFERMDFDAITVIPYMGSDSIKPFLEFAGKWTIILGLTSNEGAFDFQTLSVKDEKLFEIVLKKASGWGTEQNTMFVIGATKAEELSSVRKIIPNHFLLIPGVGAQGGSLEEVSQFGMNTECGILVNNSRQIIYASNGEDFAEKAREEAQKIQHEMSKYLELYSKLS